MQDENHYDEESDGKLSGLEQGLTDRLDRKKNPLPENITEYVQKARDELKLYDEQKKYYEKRRKKEIILELVDLLEEHDYPKYLLRSIIAQELGDYISTSYIEKIVAEKYLDEKKKVMEESNRQTAEFPQNDDKIPIELSTTGENLIANEDDLRSINPSDSNHKISVDSTESKTELEKQVEKEAEEIVKKFQDKVRNLETKCYQLDQLAREGSMWKEKYTQLQQEFRSFKSKVIRGTAEIEFGSGVSTY